MKLMRSQWIAESSQVLGEGEIGYELGVKDAGARTERCHR